MCTMLFCHNIYTTVRQTLSHLSDVSFNAQRRLRLIVADMGIEELYDLKWMITCAALVGEYTCSL